MKKIIILILMTFMSLSAVSALSIDNTIPTEINQYEFDVNSFASCNDADTCNISFSGDGTTIDLPYNLVAPYNYTGVSFSIASQEGSVGGAVWDGTNFWLAGSGTDTMYEYYLNGTYTGDSFSVSGQSTRTTGVTWDGTNFWVLDRDSDKVYSYTSTGVYTGTSFSVSSQSGLMEAITWDGTNFFIANDDDVYVYTSAGSYTGTKYTVSEMTDIFALDWDGEYFWAADEVQEEVYRLNTDFTTSGINAIQNDNYWCGKVNTDSLGKFSDYNLLLNYTFTNNGNQDYTILASNSTNTINETGSLLVNPSVSFNFEDNSTNVENYSFGGRADTNGLVTYNIYNDGLTIGENTLSFSKFGYVLQNFTFNITETQSQNYTFNVTEAAINVQIFDRITQNLITQNVDLQLIGNVGNTTTTSTGQATLRAIDGVPGSYQIIATSTGYETESVYFEYTNQENLSVDIYLLNSTDLSVGFVTIEVKDTLSFFIEGAIVNLMEWKPSISSFITVGQCQTLSNGKCNLNVELNNKLYKFQAIKNGISTETTSLILTETGLTFPLTLENALLNPTANSDNILSNMTQTLNNITNSSLLRLQWATKDNTNAKACIKVYSNPGYSQQIIASNCTVSNSGVLLMNVNINNTENIKVDGTVQDSFNTFLIDSFFYEGSGSLSKALNDFNLDILIPIIFFFIGISVGLLFGNLYIGLILGVILEWIATIIAGNVLSVSVAVVITFISGLVIWGAYKK